MITRYTDMPLSATGAQDFIIRKRSPTNGQLAIIFLITLLLSISVTVVIFNKLALMAMLIFMLGGAGWYAIVTLQRNRDMVLTTEFQNALFASALGLNNKFCIIIKRDGNIIYIDRSFQELFPDFLKQPQRSVDMLLESGRVSRNQSEKIFKAIEQGVYDKVFIDIRGANGEFYKMVMSVEPIMRPSGFILLRGREYIDERNDDAGAPPPTMLSKSSITLFAHVMDTMNMGVYMTDPAGNLIYANPLLEQWLGFQEGEMASRTMTLQDIFYQVNKRTLTIEPDNFEGEVMLQNKIGGQVKAFINQKLIRDDQKKVVGCTALVHMITGDAATSKKPW